MVDGAAISGTVVGNRFVLTAAVDPFTLVVDGTLVGNTATGTLTITGMINATGTFRLERFTPSGTTTASGMLQGIAIDLDTDSAVGSRDYSDPGLTVLEEVEVIAAHGDEHLELDFVPSGLAVGTLAVASTVMVVVTYRNDTASIELDATGGTVTITRYDDDGIAGSYSLTLDGGSTLAGTFDVAFDLEAYSP
jgi:hypothetical protein